MLRKLCDIGLIHFLGGFIPALRKASYRDTISNAICGIFKEVIPEWRICISQRGLNSYEQKRA